MRYTRKVACPALDERMNSANPGSILLDGNRIGGSQKEEVPDAVMEKERVESPKFDIVRVSVETPPWLSVMSKDVGVMEISGGSVGSGVMTVQVGVGVIEPVGVTVIVPVREGVGVIPGVAVAVGSRLAEG